ncbi:protein of unknown function [Pararobbsia alpina]|uniref:hypothetical protein n=1 Tax=Pararobbsia alpina TaxID=621374 RepID=UPI0039A445DC
MERRAFLGTSLLTLFAGGILTACGGNDSDSNNSTQSGTSSIESAPTTGVTLYFQNQRTDGYAVYIAFGGAGTLAATIVGTGESIVKGKPYALAALVSGVNVTQYDSGRIFVSLENSLTTPTEANGFAPNFDNPNLDDFGTRWDKFEITIAPPDGNTGVGTSGGANLTSQDFFGIRLDIVTSGGSLAPAHLTWRADAAKVFQDLGALSGFKVITKQDATGAIATAPHGVTVPSVSDPVIRVVSPGSVSPIDPSAGTTCYPSVQDYIAYLSGTNPPGPLIATTIQGNNGQPTNGGAFQTYDLTATIINAPTTIRGVAIDAGSLVLDGTMDAATGAGPQAYTVVVPASNLTDYGVYLANPGFSMIPANTNPNQVVEHIVADYFAALNFGIAGSTEANPNDPGSTLGNSPSWTWYGNPPSGAAQSKLPIADAFSAAQPSNSHRYNPYASYLAGVTDSYGFAYNDRLEAPLASLSDGTTLTLTIMPD